MVEISGRIVTLTIAVAVAAIVLAIGADLILSAENAAGCNTAVQRIMSQIADKVGGGIGIC